MGTRLLLLLAGLAALGSLGIHSFVPALPAAAADLAAAPGNVQLAVTLYLLGLGLGQLFGGWSSDLLGRRSVALAGLVLYLAGAFAGALASDLELLLAARVVQALGGGCLLSVSRTIVVDLAKGEDAVKPLATLGMISLLSPALAPLLGGLLTGYGGWRFVLLFLGLLGLLVFAGALVGLPRFARRAIVHSPWAGFGRLLGHGSFWRFTLAGAATSTGLFGFLAASSFVFVDVQHFSAQQSGLAYLVIAAGVAVGALITRRVGGRALTLGSVLYAAGGGLLLGALLLPRVTAALIIPMIVVGIGTGLAGPAALAGALQTDEEHVGTASSLAGALQMAAASATTSLIAAFFHPSMQTVVFPVFGAGLLLMLLLFVDRRGRA